MLNLRILKVLLKFLEEKIDHTDHGYIIGMHRPDYSISAVWERLMNATDPWTAVFAVCLWLAGFSFNASFIWREKK